MAPFFNTVVLLAAAANAVSVSPRSAYSSSSSANQILLAPEDAIKNPASTSAKEPLKHAGANGPYFAGPNVNKISSSVPDNCKVDRAAYVSRHGSRFPDTGAYNGWVSMYERFQAAQFTATGSLSFLKDWEPVLTNPSAQIAMESPTGWKEAYDMGYMLRTRYPDLYTDGDSFYTWANNYTRVIQTARNFARGFLGPRAEELGKIVSVTSKGYTGAIGNSLAPGDQCPAFSDDEGGSLAEAWKGIYIPPVQKRLQALIKGDLQLTSTDVAQMPYLCGFESQITGRLSPWCSVFTDAELLDYEYSQDLRYYYGTGPGKDLPPRIMMPFLDTLVKLLGASNGTTTGVDASGTAFEVPKLLTVFLNDGQLNQLVAASGVFDKQATLSSTKRDPSRLFVSSRYTCMRGGISWERMTCNITETQTTSKYAESKSKTTTTKEEVYVRVLLNDAVYPIPSCKSGPGSSCKLSDYTKYIADKYAAQGSWIKSCNVTTEGAPTKVQGASFFTDLSSAWIKTEAA
ncbi:hypothetical protein Cpir12675_002002 [Ceratocystis pirilliformis]|uniref:3-phytase n=1 Tax=Ceratocystis pirilliformis TaxID=259994 RepID=A0ABR3ZD57_9PEZI